MIVQGAMVAAMAPSGTPAVSELSYIAELQQACNGYLKSVLHFQKDDLQRWAKGQCREFVEVFIGTGEPTV